MITVKWKRYTIETTTEAEDYMSGMLMDLGIEGVQIENNVPLEDGLPTDMFDELRPDLPPDEGKSWVSFFFEDDGTDRTETLKAVAVELEKMRRFLNIGSGVITSSETEDLDWINNWKKFFTSFTIDDILIKPTWEERKEEDKDKFMIEIDPGISFGTGKHETTQLCIRQLLKYMRSKEGENSVCSNPAVLDIGFGSGILSLVALKLGANRVVGTDVDPLCTNAAYENMDVNGLDRSLATWYIGNLIDDEKLQQDVGFETYDIVLANILADVIIPMAPVIPRTMKKGAYLITSGIIDFKEKAVADALEAAGLTIVEVNHQGDWVNITARK